MVMGNDGARDSGRPSGLTGGALGLALAGFTLLSIGDSLIKTIGPDWPGTAIAALRFALGALGLGALLWLREGRAGFAAPRMGLQAARGLALGMASVMFFSAILVMPLADATAIQFANPMLTALVSAWLLRERADAATWAAVVAGLVGVMLVLRPNVAPLGLAVLLPLGAALGMAFLMTWNRMAAGDTSPLAAQFFVAAFAIPPLVLLALAGHWSGLPALQLSWPDAWTAARCAIVAVTASGAHWLIYAATQRSSSAAVAPAVYVQIITAVTIGFLLFGDWPDPLALLGTAIIVAAGLGLWRHGRRARG